MPDFTLFTLRRLLEALKEQQYTFQPFIEFLKDPSPRAIILRHDVDARRLNSLQTAKLEAGMGIRGTYYFRIVPQSFDPEVIKQIHALGHEIGYHYEDLTLAAKNIKGQGTRDKGQEIQSSNHQINKSTNDARLYEVAISLFEHHLAKLRQLVPVETICMHGSPLSKYDNRKLWERFNYRDYGISGEPYFDIDFNNVLYLTDTGRRWDGERVSIRDKVKRDKGQGTRDKEEIRLGDGETEGRGEKNRQPTTDNRQQYSPPFPHTTRPLSLVPCPLSSTFDIIRNASLLPGQIMLTLHPQRWDNRPLPWIREYVMQNVKNVVKRMMVD